MELDAPNLTQICRTCKCVAPQMRSIFEGYENAQSPRIDEMLMACASVQVQCGDGLPAQICQICVEQLRNAFIFKRQAEKIDANLRELSKNIKVNEIKQEPQHFDYMESLNTLNNLPMEQAKENNQEATDAPIIPKTETEQPEENNREPSESLLIPKIETEEVKENDMDTSDSPAIPNTGTDYIQFLDNDQMLLTCHECSKIFSTVKGLRCHKRIHTGTLYKCNKCDKQYTTLTYLQQHAELHTPKKVHVCKICSKTLVRIEQMKRHLMTHLKERPFPCNTCNRIFTRVEHLRNHTPRCKRDIVYPCDVCNKVFTRESSREMHKQLHDNDNQPKLPTIENLDNLDEYYYEVDQDVDAVLSDDSDVDDCFDPQIEVTENMNEDKIKEVVDLGLNDKESNLNDSSIPSGDNDHNQDSSMENVTDCLENEIDDLKEVKIENSLETNGGFLEGEDKTIKIEPDGEESSDTTDSEYLPENSESPKIKRGRGRPRTAPPKIKVPGRGRGRPKIKREEKVKEFKKFSCPACQEVFRSMRALDKHARRIHEGLKIYKCNVCNKEFSRVNHFNRHMISHSTDKPYCCQVCSKSFNRKDHLRQHIKMHEKSSELECDICQHIFSRIDVLANHRATKHGIGVKATVEKKYECPLCPKSFTTENYRNVHINLHNGEEQYECKVCKKTFLSKSYLSEHMKCHNERAKKYLCSECGQRFIRNDYLVIHMRRHRGEKPFKCKYCGKGFPRTTDLTAHEKHHTGEKSHLCTVCGRGFGRAYNLTLHMRTHTGEKPYQCTYCDAAFAQSNDLKSHVQRHTDKKFHCDLCSKSFIKGHLLTRHKQIAHDLNVESNMQCLEPVVKLETPDDPPPIISPLPMPVESDVTCNVMNVNT